MTSDRGGSSLDGDLRFQEALSHFDRGDFLEASDLFEELFFEAVRDEVPIVRFMLQISTGLHHISRGQLRAARERIEEGLRTGVSNAYGVDLKRVRDIAIAALRPR